MNLMLRPLFNGHASATTLVRLATDASLARIEQALAAGDDFNRRMIREPRLTPLDAAVRARQLDVIDLLLANGIPITGSAVYEAVVGDCHAALLLFHAHDPRYHARFADDDVLGSNPRLDRWLLRYTALDFARALDAAGCAALLEAHGADAASFATRCPRGHYAPWLAAVPLVCFGAMHHEGVMDLASGVHCLRCNLFVRNSTPLTRH